MDNNQTDNKRTIKANIVKVFEQNGSAPNGIDANPGDCQYNQDDSRLMFACPGCGLWGSIYVSHPKASASPSWDIVKGSPSDPTTLSLTPSIYCISCCGWHGYLTDGIFKSC